jgi:hypothetical protein
MVVHQGKLERSDVSVLLQRLRRKDLIELNYFVRALLLTLPGSQDSTAHAILVSVQNMMRWITMMTQSINTASAAQTTITRSTQQEREDAGRELRRKERWRVLDFVFCVTVEKLVGGTSMFVVALYFWGRGYVCGVVIDAWGPR